MNNLFNNEHIMSNNIFDNLISSVVCNETRSLLITAHEKHSYQAAKTASLITVRLQVPDTHTVHYSDESGI